MRILILSWRDTKHPAKGGAEVATYEMARRWVAKGHVVTWFCASFEGAQKTERMDGVEIIRSGTRWSVYVQACRHYTRAPRGAYDLVIDEINTVPFFAPWYVRERVVALVYQLAREVWFHEIGFPVSVLGYLAERIYMKVYARVPCMTISRSTRQDLMDVGCRQENIAVLPMGIDFDPLDAPAQKECVPTFIYVGRLKRSKRVHHILRAFAVVKNGIADAQLWIVGDGDARYKRRLLRVVRRHGVTDVRFWGYVDSDTKLDLMSRAHAIVVASVREGWGLVVTEANAMGTPAIVYDVPGLRDSTRDGETGIVCRDNTVEALAEEMVGVVRDEGRRKSLEEGALRSARQATWDRAAEAALQSLETWR